MKISWNRHSKPLMNADVYAQTHKPAHNSRSSSCRKTSAEARHPMSLHSVFAFLQRIYVSRKKSSFIHPPDAEHYTHKNTHMARISVSACQFLLWCWSLLSESLYSRKEQLPWIHTRRKHRIQTELHSVNQLWSL